MAKANRECHTCSAKYYYCPTCPDDSRNPRIYVMWCGERCAKIFNLLSDETFNNITTAECKEELLKLNITEKDNLKDSIKKHIQRVIGSEQKESVVEVANEEIKEMASDEPSDVVETVETVEVVEAVVEEAAESIETSESVDVNVVSEITDNNFGYKKRNKKYRNSEVN